jgi:hypothetical protein
MSRHPLRTEIHRVVIQLDGNHFKGTLQQNSARYKKYMTALKTLAKQYGARVTAKECLLKQSEITRIKKAMLKAK